MRRLGVTGFHCVFTGEDLFHAGGGEGGLRVDRDDFRVSVIGSHESAIELRGLVPVRGVLAGAGDESPVFYALAVVIVVTAFDFGSRRETVFFGSFETHV